MAYLQQISPAYLARRRRAFARANRVSLAEQARIDRAAWQLQHLGDDGPGTACFNITPLAAQVIASGNAGVNMTQTICGVPIDQLADTIATYRASGGIIGYVWAFGDTTNNGLTAQYGGDPAGAAAEAAKAIAAAPTNPAPGPSYGPASPPAPPSAAAPGTPPPTTPAPAPTEFDWSASYWGIPLWGWLAGAVGAFLLWREA
jgi:hypothetical protein